MDVVFVLPSGRPFRDVRVRVGLPGSVQPCWPNRARRESRTLYDYMTGPAFKLAWENVRSQYVRLRESHDSAKRSFLQRWNREEKMLASAEQSVIDFLTTVLEIGGGSLDLPPVYPEDPEGLPDPEDGDDV